MNSILNELVGSICLVYIDDIIVFGQNSRQHKENLEIVLNRLKDFDIKIKPAKCKIGYKKIEFMGYIVSGTEVDDSLKR